MKYKSIIFIALIAMILSITGCKNVPPVTSGIGTDKVENGQEYSQFLQLHNEKLSSQLSITDVKSRKINDLLEVNLQLTSHYEKSLKLQYHFNWFDKDGFAIESRKSPWQPLDLHGMQTTTVRGLAPSTQVASFNIYVREVPEKAFKF